LLWEAISLLVSIGRGFPDSTEFSLGSMMGVLMQLQLDSRQIEHKDGSKGLSQRTLSMASEQLQSPPHGVLVAPSALGAGDAT
jgi:hypothetical protein